MGLAIKNAKLLKRGLVYEKKSINNNFYYYSISNCTYMILFRFRHDTRR